MPCEPFHLHGKDLGLLVSPQGPGWLSGWVAHAPWCQRPLPAPPADHPHLRNVPRLPVRPPRHVLGSQARWGRASRLGSHARARADGAEMDGPSSCCSGGAVISQRRLLGGGSLPAGCAWLAVQRHGLRGALRTPGRRADTTVTLTPFLPFSLLTIDRGVRGRQQGVSLVRRIPRKCVLLRQILRKLHPVVTFLLICLLSLDLHHHEISGVSAEQRGCPVSVRGVMCSVQATPPAPHLHAGGSEGALGLQWGMGGWSR